MQWFVDLLLKLFGMLLNRPSPLVEQSREAGAAQQQVRDLQKAVDDVQKATQASEAVRRADAADPGGLRDQADPDCRDCKVQ